MKRSSSLTRAKESYTKPTQVRDHLPLYHYRNFILCREAVLYLQCTICSTVHRHNALTCTCNSSLAQRSLLSHYPIYIIHLSIEPEHECSHKVCCLLDCPRISGKLWGLRNNTGTIMYSKLLLTSRPLKCRHPCILATKKCPRFQQFQFMLQRS